MLKNSQILIYLVIFIISATEMAGDMFAPSLPDIKHFYGVDESITQLLVSLNLLGVGLSALIYGPLSDRIGRRKAILLGMFLFALGGVTCLFQIHFVSFLIARIVQGLGAGCAVVVGFAAVHDIYKGDTYAAALSRIGMAIALSPGLAPIVGGYIAIYWGWYWVLWVIALVSCALWVLLLKKMPETKKKKYEPINILDFSKEMVAGYRTILKNRQYIIFMFIQVFVIASIWGEMANLPFVFIEGMGLAIDLYGYCVAIGVGAFIIGMKINQMYVEKYSASQMLKIGLGLKVLSALFAIGTYKLGYATPFCIQTIMIPGAIGTALVISNATACAMNSAENHTGSASALMASLEMIFGSLIISIISYFYNGTIVPIVLANLFCVVSGVFLLYINHLLILRR